VVRREIENLAEAFDCTRRIAELLVQSSAICTGTNRNVWIMVRSTSRSRMLISSVQFCVRHKERPAPDGNPIVWVDLEDALIRLDRAFRVIQLALVDGAISE